MKIYDLTEIIAGLLVVLGFGAMTAAATMVAPALGVLAAGVFLVIIGLIGIYMSSQAEQGAAKAQTSDETRGRQ